ncbi:MAG: hypothetical protein H0T51_18005, partial [Pirellulales bacterium]|nr:hypothetical protein [Pirellulales bacterium]
MKINTDVNSKHDHAQCRPKVFFGKVLLTAGVYDGIPVSDVVTALHRHRVGDWGHVSDEDREENELALREG